MAGTLAVITWGIGATLEPMPLSLRLTFVACGTIAAVVGGFLIWRAERHNWLSAAARLKLMRMASYGERLVAELESSTQSLSGTLGTSASLVAWWEECRGFIKEEYPNFWDHFADLGELEPHTMEQQARLLIRKIRDLLDVMDRK